MVVFIQAGCDWRVNGERVVRRFLLLISMGIIGFVLIMLVWRLGFYESISPVRGEFVEIQDHALYITDQGKGQAVVFLPGLLIHSDTWFEIASQPPLGYRYITLDWPGSGFSTKRDISPLTPADMSMILKLFLDKMDIKEVVLVGFDVGGGVAMISAARYTNLVKGVVLVAPDSSFGKSLAILGPWWHWPLIRTVVAASQLDRAFVRRYIHQCWSTESSNWRNLVERYYLPLNFKHARRNFIANHLGCRSFHYLPYEERIQSPVKIIWGAEDGMNPVEHGQLLVQSIKSAELTVLPDTGHLPQEQQTSEVKDLIRSYLETIRLELEKGK